VPIVIGTPDRVVVVHAGWRGVAGRIVDRALAELPSPPTAATAWIGPSIGPCCYGVGDDVAARVVAAAGAGCLVAGTAGSRPHLDLTTAVEFQLHAAGVLRVAAIRACTRCQGYLHSFRRDGEAADRNLTFGWLRGRS
jgi:copper oxidase (laccase) domain-containing protein